MRFYWTKLLFQNAVFLFLIAGVTYVFTSRRLPQATKHGLLLAKLVLFLGYLTAVYFFDTKGSNFVQRQNPDDLPVFLARNARFSLDLKDPANRTVSLDQEFETRRRVTVLSWKDSSDAEVLLQSALKKIGERVVFLKYKDEKRNYAEMAPHILQSLKNDLLSFRGKTNTTLVFENLPRPLYELDFVELLILLENNVPELRFVILESDAANIRFLRTKYKYLHVREIAELDPQVFKSLAIDIILRSFYNKLSDVQAAKAAHELYAKKGASLKELVKLQKKYS